MTQLIDKSALLEYLNQLYEKHSTPNSVDEGGVVINDIEYFLDTLEVKEVDLERENQELRHQIRLLIDAIDHAYLRLDGTYGDLSYEVSDQVKYVKSIQTKELEGRM